MNISYHFEPTCMRCLVGAQQRLPDGTFIGHTFCLQPWMDIETVKRGLDRCVTELQQYIDETAKQSIKEETTETQEDNKSS